MCDRVLIMNNGRLVYTESLAQMNSSKKRHAEYPACPFTRRAGGATEGVVNVTTLGENRFCLLQRQLLALLKPWQNGLSSAAGD